MEAQAVRPFGRWGSWWWVALAIFLFVSVSIPLWIAWDLAGDDDAELPSDFGSVVTTWTLCPTPARLVQVKGERFEEAAREAHGHGLPTVIVRGACDGPPRWGEVQIRHHADQVDPFRVQLEDGRGAQLVSEGRPVARGVIYVDPVDAARCTYAHELLHTHGIGLDYPDGRDGHATAGVMARDCDAGAGWSWDLVDRVLALRVYGAPVTR